VSEIGRRGAARSERRDVAYSFKIIDNDDEINAFALPGGPIYVYTGLHYMFGAGYSPNAMTSFQKKLGKLQSENPSRALNLLSAHPLSQDRIDAIREEISRLPPGRPVYYHSERYKGLWAAAEVRPGAVSGGPPEKGVTRCIEKLPYCWRRPLRFPF